MSAIIEQFELNRTFFIQFAIFAALFFLMANVYFKPFLKLFEARHRRTVEDRESAEKLLTEANAKLESYRERLATERAHARKDYEDLIKQVKAEEAEILNRARSEAKKITQEAMDSIQRQQDQLKRELEAEVETLAQTISDKLLLRRS